MCQVPWLLCLQRSVSRTRTFFLGNSKNISPSCSRTFTMDTEKTTFLFGVFKLLSSTLLYPFFLSRNNVFHGLLARREVDVLRCFATQGQLAAFSLVQMFWGPSVCLASFSPLSDENTQNHTMRKNTKQVLILEGKLHFPETLSVLLLDFFQFLPVRSELFLEFNSAGRKCLFP